jgi:hypothetical protein
MATLNSKISKPLIASLLLTTLSVSLRAEEPDGGDLNRAIKEAGFGRYLENVSAWLNRTVPATISETAVSDLLKDSDVRNKLAQRQLIAKLGAEHVNAFVKDSSNNREFLSWLLQNTEAMEQYLLGATPIGLAAREQNAYTLNPRALEIWKDILHTDPDSKEGLYLKLAIATAISPPGSVNIGAGGAATPADPVVRYNYYKTAHQNGELFPRFDNLTVWEYSTIVCSGATDADLTWAREMINTFRPDLRVDERVVHSTSLVWRRAAPAKFYPAGYQNFRNVLAGGGKCGPRASWAQMVCQAFGIPVVGVRQPGHACAAYKAANPMIEPQPGNVWKVVYGRGWHVSKAMGLAGPDFLAGVQDRADFAKFSKVERLRWLASSLASDEQAAAVMAAADKIRSSTTKVETNPTASPEPVETDAPTSKPTGPTKMVEGVIHVEAASFVKTGGEISWGGQFPHVLVHDCLTGGKQAYFQSQMKSQWADYLIDVPAPGTYEITLRAAVINDEQELEICRGGKVIATVPIPLNFGIWKETPPVELKLQKGVQTLRVQTPTTEHKRGIALKSFDFKVRE